MTTATQSTDWDRYVDYLKSCGYEPYEDHKNCRRHYGVNGSCGYWCTDHKVKVLPAP